MPHSHELDASDVLAVKNLNIAFEQEQQRVSAVRNVSFRLQRGETLAIVGESGSGKSVTALSLMRLIEQAGGDVHCDQMLLRRRNRQVIELGEQSDAQMQRVRGADIAMIFQEPMTSLNPVFTVGEQIAESIRLHQGASREEAMAEAKRMLDQVRIPESQAILSRYPHQLSGGMRQRVMIALAHPAGKLKRKSRHNLRRIGNLHLFQQGDGFLPRRQAAHRLMMANDFHHLLPNAPGGIQRRHWLLEDHRHARAAPFTHLLFAGIQHILAQQRYAALMNVIAAFRQQPHCQHGGDGFT